MAAVQGALVQLLAVDQAEVVPHRLLGEQAKATELDSGDVSARAPAASRNSATGSQR